MQIGLTKKLQDQIAIKVDKGNEESDIFSWTANLITVNRRKTVVVINNLTRYGFVLYGLKAKEFKNIENLILDGIRECLKALRIDDTIIEKYICDGGAIAFTKTKGPKVVSMLNRVCICAEWFDDLFDKDNIYQRRVSKKMNRDLIKIHGSNDYGMPSEIMVSELKDFYSVEVIKCKAAELLVKLDLDVYFAERKVIVPLDIDFMELHKILQITYGWANYHLHDFLIYDKNDKCVLRIISTDEEELDVFSKYKVVYESDIMISEYINKGYKIIYEYDFGDDWRHEIIIQDLIENFDKNYPVCISVDGEAPPEDVGGVVGYKEFLEIMKNPNHPEYDSLKRWAQSQRYYMTDIKTVNRRLELEI